MAIQINGTTVIDNSRNVTASTVTISGYSAVGTAPVAIKQYGTKVTTKTTLINKYLNPDFNSADAVKYYDNYGYAAAISGRYFAVGANSEKDATNTVQTGRVYVYDINSNYMNAGTTPIYTIINPTAAVDNFGYSIALDNGILVIGAPYYNSNSGRVYIYDINNGNTATGNANLLWTLENPNSYDTTANDLFGYNVAICGNYIAVSATGEDTTNTLNSGKVYVYNAKTSSLLYTIDNPNAYGTGDDDRFGSNLAISDRYLAVGTPYEDSSNVTDSGIVYVYNVKTGTLLYTLNNPNPVQNGHFAYPSSAVSITNNYLAVGGSTSSDYIVYLYSLIDGSLIRTITKSKTTVNSNFGQAISMSDDYIIVSASTTNPSGMYYDTNNGRVFVYDINGNELAYIDYPKPNPYLSYVARFGTIVGISGNNIMITADDLWGGNGGSQGSAFIYTLNNVYDDSNVSKVYLDSAQVIDKTTHKLYKQAHALGDLTRILTNPKETAATAQYEMFGSAIAASGNITVVGTPRNVPALIPDYGTTYLSGPVYVFDTTTGRKLFELSDPNPGTVATKFGSAVSVYGNYIAVGAPAYNSNKGAVYLFSAVTGELVYTFTQSAANSQFGTAVAIGKRTLVGWAPGQTNLFLYDINNLSTTPESITAGSSLSRTCVFISDGMSPNSEIMMIGDDTYSSNSGNVGVYRIRYEPLTNVRSSVKLTTLSNPNVYGSASNDYFGYSVASYGNYAVVGAYGETNSNSFSSDKTGRAYVYNLKTGAKIYTLENPTPSMFSANDYFGYSVAINDKYILVGAPYKDDDANNSGRAYLFSVSTGSLLYTFTDPSIFGPANTGDVFGVSVALSGDYALFGAPYEDGTSASAVFNSGAVYQFSCKNMTYLDKLTLLGTTI